MRKVCKMLHKMSEAQRSVLQTAAACDDHLLQPPGSARGAVAKSLAAKLVDAGWAKETKASSRAPVWRRDAATGVAYALKLTAKGLKAVAPRSEGPDGAEHSSPPTAAETAPQNAPARNSARPVRAHGVTPEGKPSNVTLATTVRAPRSNSKLGDVLAKLSAEAGATIGELMKTTGWLEHTTRAALTGLRRRGYTFNLTRGERGGASVYRIAMTGGEENK
jgi:hypothetical protein